MPSWPLITTSPLPPQQHDFRGFPERFAAKIFQSGPPTTTSRLPPHRSFLAYSPFDFVLKMSLGFLYKLSWFSRLSGALCRGNILILTTHQYVTTTSSPLFFSLVSLRFCSKHVLRVSIQNITIFEAIPAEPKGGSFRQGNHYYYHQYIYIYIYFYFYFIIIIFFFWRVMASKSTLIQFPSSLTLKLSLVSTACIVSSCWWTWLYSEALRRLSLPEPFALHPLPLIDCWDPRRTKGRFWMLFQTRLVLVRKLSDG